MHVSSKVMLATALVPLWGGAGNPTGTVLDPHDLGVPNAQITLTCNGRTTSVRSDARGGFTFQGADQTVDCSISVTRLGFAPFRERLGRNTENLLVRLTIAPLTQSVTVTAGQEIPTAPLRKSLTSVSLSDDELRQVSNNTADLIRYAKQYAGAPRGQTAVYVDGLPGGTLPPANTVARITVNADPFSAEYADGDITAINIITKSPGRQFRFNFGGASLGAGGSDTLVRNLQSKSRDQGGGMNGPIPGLPLTFSMHLSVGSSQADVPVLPVLPSAESLSQQPNPRSARVRNQSGSGSIDVYYSGTKGLRAHLAYRESRSTGTNLGVGGVTLPDAGFGSSLTIREARLTTTKSEERFEYRGGLVMTQMSSDTRANSEGPGVVVLGDFVTGGAPIANGTSLRTTWTFKNVVESVPGPPSWVAGLSVSRSGNFKKDTPNPGGSFTFDNPEAYQDALRGEPTGTWSVTRGSGALHYDGLDAGPFVQRELVRSSHLLVTGGLRADYQSGFGTILSPRLATAAHLRGLVLRVGVGLFVRNVGSNVFVRAIETDGFHLRQFMALNAPIFDTSSLPLDPPTIRTRLASDLTRPRQLMQKASLERTFGKLTLNVEYTSTRDWHLLGSRRLPDEGGWLDLLESNRSAERHRIHPQFRYRRGTHAVAVHYDWIRSRDNTDGPFSFPAQQDSIHAEWARSAGIPTHNITITDSFYLPGALYVTLTDSWRSTAPFNVTTGNDSAGNGLYTDRGGRARNSGNGPGYNSLELHASKRIALPNLWPKTHKKVYVNLGAQGDNLLGNRDYIGFGSVVGSPTFGLPLGTLPGRSLRVWLNLD